MEVYVKDFQLVASVSVGGGDAGDGSGLFQVVARGRKRFTGMVVNFSMGGGVEERTGDLSDDVLFLKSVDFFCFFDFTTFFYQHSLDRCSPNKLDSFS